MKKLLSRLSLASPVLLLATQASAHPSGHTALSTTEVLSHLFASPYHALMTVGIFLVLVFIIHNVSYANQSE
jgi:hypothetical protein